MNETEAAQESLSNRNWYSTTELLKRLIAMGLTLIRVKSCNKVPNEGRGWQQTEHRSYHNIGFNPEDNAGVITDKRSGIIVLDVDDQAAFTKACQENNRIVPVTFTVRTGNGFHYYYKRPQDDRDYRNRSRKSEGWDIRANGGYIVAPGSIHPNGSVYTVVDDRGFTEAPEWLLEKSLRNGEYAKADRKSKAVRRKGQVQIHYDLPEVDLDTLSINEWTRTTITEGAKDGERSEATFSVIKALLNAGYEPDEIVAVFMASQIGEKAREKDDPEGWVYDDIDRIKAKLESFKQIEAVPEELPKRTMPIPDIKSLRIEYQTLVEYSHKDLIETIRGYGNVTSESQEQALYTLLHTYAALADGKITGRMAAPLPTGLGKTTSIIAFLGRAFSMHMLGKGKRNFTVAVAASKVDQLCDLHEALVKSGIPESYISLVHSYKYNPEVQRDADGQLPKGYAALPASPDKNRPILLLSHNKVKNGPEHAFDDSLQKRTFVIWDESLISTDSKALDFKRIAHGLNAFEFGVNDLNEKAQVRDTEVDPTKLEVANSTMMYLQKVKACIQDEISSQRHGRPKEVVKFPHANETTLLEMLMAVEWVALKQGVEEAKGLIGYLKTLLRVTGHDTSVHLGKIDSNAVVRFDVVVPDAMKNMVILDASARINTLMMLDETIHLPENLPDLHLSYGGTVFHRIDHPAGRGAIQKELENGEKSLMAGITEVIQKHPGESILLFTFKHREGELHHREVIEKYLSDNGIDIHEKINGKPRFNWLTHGNETASNKYTHCSVAIFTGLMHKPREVSLGETVAQSRDHTASISEKLLTQVIRGGLSQAVHQGANRTASRTIENDQAHPVSVYYTYHNDALIPYLEQVLPDAYFTVYDSEVMAARTLTVRGRRAVVKYLNDFAEDVKKIASRMINKAVPEMSEVSSTTRKKIIRSIADDVAIPWIGEGKSLVRV